MKQLILSIAFLFLAATSSCQEIDAYRYVVLPTLTYGEGKDPYDLSSILKTEFINRGVKVVDFNNLPSDLEENKCLAVYATVSVSTGYGIEYWGRPGNNGVVEINLLDCDENTVYNGVGTTQYGSPWNIVFQESARRCLKKLKYNYSARQNFHRMRPMFPYVLQTYITENTIKEYLQSIEDLNLIEGIYKSYQSSTTPHYKFGIIKHGDNYKAILIESAFKHWKAGEVKAEFEPLATEGRYSVKWRAGDKEEVETFAWVESNGILAVEFVNPKTGVKTKGQFIKLFPKDEVSSPRKEKPERSTGSGFVIDAAGFIATNAHVVDGAKEIEIGFLNHEKESYLAKTVLIDRINDLAILQITDEGFQTEKLPYGFWDKADIGEQVFTIGFPLNKYMGKNFKVTDGIISSNSGFQDDIRYYQISTPLQPGSSGGPLFNSKGQVVGVSSAKLLSTEEIEIEGVGYAIKVSYLNSLIAMAPEISKPASSSRFSDSDLPSQVKQFKNHVYLITARF